MRHFPIFIALEGRRVVLSGGGDAALAKLRLLMKTQARITVFAEAPAPDILRWAGEGRLTVIRRRMGPGDALCAALFYAADENAAEDARTVALARADGALTNIVDNLEGSQFITPAIVDRDPVTVAIGTEGTAPVLARRIKADVEALLPACLGTLARAARAFRSMAEALPMGRPRRAFWTAFFDHSGPEALDRGEDLQTALKVELARHLGAQAAPGHITFAIVASDDPGLLPHSTRQALHEADLVLHGEVAAPVLDLARREATFGTLPISARPMVEAASRGDHVLCLVGTTPDARLLTDCHRAGFAARIIPGIAPVPAIFPLEETA